MRNYFFREGRLHTCWLVRQSIYSLMWDLKSEYRLKFWGEYSVQLPRIVIYERFEINHRVRALKLWIPSTRIVKILKCGKCTKSPFPWPHEAGKASVIGAAIIHPVSPCWPICAIWVHFASIWPHFKHNWAPWGTDWCIFRPHWDTDLLTVQLFTSQVSKRLIVSARWRRRRPCTHISMIDSQISFTNINGSISGKTAPGHPIWPIPPN